MPMHSSTSSSNTRLPSASYRWIWLCAIGLFVLSLFAIELSLRAIGRTTKLLDSDMLWSQFRHDVYTRDGEKALVVVGSSRFQLGLDGAALAAAFPDYRVVNLSRGGRFSFEVLRDLCLDEAFDGLILCDASVDMMMPVADERRSGREMVAFYRRFRTELMPERRLEDFLKRKVHEYLVSIDESMMLRNLIETRFEVLPSFGSMNKERFVDAYYLDSLDEEQLVERRRDRARFSHARLLEPEEFRAKIVTEVARSVSTLQKRGGDVVFVRMPTTGEVLRKQSEAYPRSLYYDVMVMSSGATSVHFANYPELSRFECPDDSHIDATDKTEFTRALCSIIKSN